MTHGRVACVVGPTASGKSEVAEEVALRLGGEVVSVDSMQVYRGMDIGTAKVLEENRRVRLHMVDVAYVTEAYSVARFQRDARACVDDVLARRGMAVLCGGTGLYLDAVVDELVFPAGEVQEDRRRRYEEMASREGPDRLYALLRERDLRSAELINPGNVRRVIRALELCDEGTSYAERHEGLKAHTPHYESMIWALAPPREVLYRRIEERVDAMFEAGLVEEVRRLDTVGLRRSVTARQAIGYKEVLGMIDGEYDLEEAVRLVKRNTRRYAKRQLSWIRRDGRARLIEAQALVPAKAAEVICREWEESHGAL